MIPIRLSEEGLWELAQQNRYLKEHRDDIRHDWDDSAARQINTRHLDPLAEDAEQLLVVMRSQHEMLSKAQEHLSKVDIHGLEAARAGRALHESLQLAEVGLRESHGFLSSSEALLVVLRHGLLPQIQQALKNANECGS